MASVLLYRRRRSVATADLPRVRRGLVPSDLDLLKTEMQIVASKIAGTVDTLWKIRGLQLTLWAAIAGISFKDLPKGTPPSAPLLILGGIIPLLFLVSDIKNNQWYRRLSWRERAISRFLNGKTDDGYGSRYTDPFPIPDVACDLTFVRPNDVEWRAGVLFNLANPIPLSVYGGEIVASALALWWFTCGPLSTYAASAFLAIVAIAIVAHAVIAFNHRQMS